MAADVEAEVMEVVENGGAVNGREEREAVGDVPDNANAHCVGTESDQAGKASACEGCPNQEACATAPKGPDPELAAITERMRSIKHKVLVLSGKGGVGKSTVAAQLSFALAALDKQVGLLDIDICGPSLPKMLGLEGEEVHQSNLGWSPVYVDDNLGVMSIGFMLPDPDEAVVWRGPRKNGLIKQFLKDVFWGDIDYLIVDAPPGTSDEHISIAQYLKATNVDGAVIVTTPQEVSIIDVRKEINFCKKVGIRVLGVVENMSELQVKLSQLRFQDTSGGAHHDVTSEILSHLRQVAPQLLDTCVACADVFHSTRGGGEAMAEELGVPFLGRVPMDPTLGRAAEEGRSCFVGEQSGPSAQALQRIVKRLLATTEAL
eukprot:jgi/Chlat1/8321/Chrsp8S08090